MFKILITSPEVKTVNGTSAKGRAWTMRFQRGYLATVDKDGVVAEIPDKFEFVLPDDVPEAYPRGVYNLHPSALSVGFDGKLSIQPRLVPLKEPVAGEA